MNCPYDDAAEQTTPQSMNRVPKGYKQTEVGVIPEDWDVKPLGALATFRTGPFGSALHKSDYTVDGIPLINPMHILDGVIVPTPTMTVSAEAAISLADFRVKTGEIVIGRRGDMGRCAVIETQQSGWLCGTGSMIVRPLGGNSHFLQRVLSSPRAISAIEDCSVGSTMVNLNQGTLAALKIQCPPLAEQSAIATALSDVNALIAKLDQLIAKQRDLKQAAMQELLTGRRRLPGFAGEWQVKLLREITTSFSGGTPSTAVAEYYLGDIPWITSADLNQGHIRDVQGRISELGLVNSSAKMIDPGTLVIALYGATAGTPAIAGLRAAINQAVLALIPVSANPHFLFYELVRLKEWIVSTYTQGGQPNLSGEIVRSIPVSLPRFAEQTAIAAVLSDMDAEMTALEARRDKTKLLKQGMMQELLTGRSRLV